MNLKETSIYNKAILILGSSRSNGNTLNLVNRFDPNKEIEFIDLNQTNISPFDYYHQNHNDDFIPIMQKIAHKKDYIILATPVYWYTMSAQMKTFLDRLSDLITIEKDLGRMLRGKKLLVLASYSTSIPSGFELAFSQTCDYLGIKYCGCFFYFYGEDRLLKQDNANLAKFKASFFI